jgi:formiminotetrahydrofolate cyclodeaminase
MEASVSFLELPLEELLDEIAGPRAAPAAGSVLALTTAMAAAIVAMAARVSREEWEEAGGAAAQAQALRARAAPLAQSDALAYEEALTALGGAAGADDRENWQIGRALARAAEPPLEIATLACDVAQLAAEVAHRTNHQLRPDALAAASLAAASARGAAELVAVNLTATPDDPRVIRARALAADAAAAAEAAYAD